VIVFRNVRVIDAVADTSRPGLDVTVEGERIASIEAADPARTIPTGATVIEGDGGTLLPGLIDCHAHYTLDPNVQDAFGLFRHDPPMLLRAAGMARRALEGGVTTARSAGSPGNLDVLLRDGIDEGHVPGPRLLAAGPALTITGGHGWRFGREADGEAGFVTAVRANVRDGADVIKVVASEAAMLTTSVAGVEEMTQGELDAVVREAARLRRRVLSHAQGSEAVIRSARAGVASIEHAFLADERALDVVAECGVTLVPTLVVTDVWRDLPGRTEQQRARQGELDVLHRRSCERAIQLGIPIAAGTDAGLRGVFPEMVAREIRLIHEHGAAPIDAIRAGTSRAAELLGLGHEIGTVEVGKRADLVIVEGDPLDDLSRLSRPRLVMQAGRVVHRA
jgi:imidazolonepropionase-like amidohydrolase